MEKLFSEQQYIDLLKLTITKMRLLHAQRNQSEDEETRTYLKLAVNPYRILLGYLLHCKQINRGGSKKLD
jgi:hypothetical protein